MGQTAYAAPLYPPKFREFTAAGAPLAGGKVYTYIAGTTTPLATYPTYDDAIANTNTNANPVILDANGQGNIFLVNSLYKIIVKDSTDVVQYTVDDYSPALSYAQPFPTDYVQDAVDTFTFVSTTSFKIVAADRTATYHPGRRILTANTGGSVYSTVVSSAFATDTTIVVVNDGSGVLDSGLSAVYAGFLAYTNPSYLDPRTAVSVIKNGTQTGFAAQTLITAWTEELDSNGEYTAPTWTCRYPGRYAITLQAEISDTVASQLATLEILKNGSTTLRRSLSYTAPTGGNKTTPSCSVIVDLVAGNTISAYLTGTVNTSIYGTVGSSLTIQRIP